MSGVPSDDATRAWRARNRNIMYRSSEDNTAIKLCAERYDHIETFAAALKSIEARHEGIYSDGDKLWNKDGT